jgi:CubicO group peptidase (beta-lactamase class C family)
MIPTDPRRSARGGEILLAIFAAALCLAAPLSASEPQTLEDRIEAVFAGIGGPDAPGCALGVIRDGEFVYRKAWGMANLEYGIPLSTASVFRLGSVSKQFTATALLLLQERGKLDIDADVHTYLPDLADYGYEVTLRQMLNHVAGMADYGDFPEKFRNAAGGEFRWGNEDYLSTPEFYDKVRQLPLLHPPGTKFLYSNFAYFLLGQVVERVSGMTISRFAEENIFRPLGMTHSQFYDDVNRIVRNRATGYRQKKDGKWEWFGTNLPYVGDGGVYSTVDDFLYWDRHFYHNPLGKGGPGLIEQMLTPGPIARYKEEGVETQYAMGLEISEDRGHPKIAHSGSWQAFATYYARYPDLRFSVVLFCNADSATAYKLAGRIIDLYLEAPERPTG